LLGNTFTLATSYISLCVPFVKDLIMLQSIKVFCERLGTNVYGLLHRNCCSNGC